MESNPMPLQEKQVLLAETDDLSIYCQAGTDCAGALAQDAQSCAAVAEAVQERIPVGFVLNALPGPAAPDTDCFSPTEALIAANKARIPTDIPEQADFLYLRGTDSFASLRCLVLAATDMTGRSLTAELPVAAEGLMSYGTEVVAAVGILQRIGVSTIILHAEDPADLEYALTQTAPYARVPLGVRVTPEWICDRYQLPGAELFVPQQAQQIGSLRAALARWGNACSALRLHDDFVLAPDGTHAHFIDPTIDISDEIPLDAHFSERLLEAEDESGAIKLELREEEDLVRFEEQVFMLTRPVCLCAEQPELLERALRIYPGRALYDGTWELEPRLIKYFSEKYGMVPL